MTHPLSAIPGATAKLITCVLADDGSDQRLLAQLRETHGVTRADSHHCRRVPAIEAAKLRHKVPEASLSRVVTVVADEDEAPAIFDFICAQVGMNQPSGAVYMIALAFATPMTMPEAAVPAPRAGAQAAGPTGSADLPHAR